MHRPPSPELSPRVVKGVFCGINMVAVHDIKLSN